MRRALDYVLAIGIAAIMLVAIFIFLKPGHTSVAQSHPSPSVAASPSPSPTPATTPTPAPAPAPAAANTYAVKKGDSLWSIATALYPGRTNACYTVLYRLNAATIEASAKAHGHRTSQHGRWLFVGEVLRLPSRC